MKTKMNVPVYFYYIIAILFLGYLYAAAKSSKLCQKDDTRQYTYKIKPISEPVKINAEWNKKVWNDTEVARLLNYMGDKPSHFPDTRFKVRYDDKNIYVIFQVKDQYVKAVAKKINDSVWEDSCVEFFFTPGPDVNKGYFNLETNCKGIFLFRYSNKENGLTGLVELEDCKKINIAHSLQRDVETEITEPVTWSIEYAVPFSVLEKYMKTDKPGKGVQWRANFYKCGDKTSHKHYLTWAPVINPVPKFHLPEYFGWLQFE
jgi:hypothetical protein